MFDLSVCVLLVACHFESPSLTISCGDLYVQFTEQCYNPHENVGNAQSDKLKKINKEIKEKKKKKNKKKSWHCSSIARLTVTWMNLSLR